MRRRESWRAIWRGGGDGAGDHRGGGGGGRGAGRDSFWVNDTPGADSLERLAAAACVTSRIRLGTGVIPLDRRPAGEIIARVRELALPTERLILGVGPVGAGLAVGACGMR